jgi:RHS repeat-associated protein
MGGNAASSTLPRTPSQLASAHFDHLDHLGGVAVVTSATGTVEEVTDYLPYGGTRFDEQTGFTSKKKFTGHESDEDTGLIYMKARYYDSTSGRFLSQDPAYLLIGSKEFDKKYQIDMQKYLLDPQLLDSYSYARLNPVTSKDTTGEIVDTILDAAFIMYDIYNLKNAYSNGESTKQYWKSLGLDIGGAALPGVTGLGFVAGHLDDVSKTGKFSNEAIKLFEQTNNSGKMLIEGVENTDVLSYFLR